MTTLTLLVLLVLGAGDLREHLPEQLTQAMQARRATTSQIEWTVTWIGGYADGMVERLVTRSAGDSLWQSNPGDERGFHYERLVDEDGNPIAMKATKGTRTSLIFDGRAWYLYDAERPTTGQAVSLDDEIPPYFRPLDFTAAGLGPSWRPNWNQTILGMNYEAFEGFDSATFSSIPRRHMETLVAEFNGRRLEWDVDSFRGGQPVRAAYYRGDRLVHQSETELSNVSGRWFPKRISFYAPNEDYNYEPVLSHIIEVREATFDQSWHMQEIRPEDIGILFGTALWVPDAPPGRFGDGYMRWDGTRLLSDEEYRLLHWGYGIEPDPRITNLKAELFHNGSLEEWQKDVERSREWFRGWYYKEYGEAPWLAERWKERDEWDEYVEKFVKKHKFDEKRVERAEDLLRRAKQLRDYEKRTTDDDIAKAMRRKEEPKVTRLQEAGKKRKEQIFDMLVRGLKLLVPKEAPKPQVDRDAGPAK